MKKISKMIICLVIAVITILLIFSSASSKSAEEKKVRIGFQPSAHHAAGAIAFEKGWFKEAGINATVAGIFWAGGSPEMEAMRAGEMDVAYVGISPVINAIGHGLDAKVVAQAQKEAQCLVVAATNGTPDWKYREPKDLEGKTIGTLTAGSIQDVVLNHWLDRQDKLGNVDKEKVTVRYMGVPDMMQGLAAKQLDGIYFSEELASIPVVDGYGAYANLTSKQTWLGHPCCQLLVSGKLIREKPELVRDLVKIHIKGTEYAIAHPEETAKIVYDFFGFKEHGFKYEAIRHGILKGIIPIGWDHNPYNVTNATMELVKVHLNRGYIEKELTEDDIFDYRFYDNVTKGKPLPTPAAVSPMPKPSGFEAILASASLAIISALLIYKRLRKS